MSAHPYRPSGTPIDSPRSAPPSVRLFGPIAIVAHTVLSTSMAGALLAAVNHRRLGNVRAFWRTMVLFVVPGAMEFVLKVGSGGPTSPQTRLLLISLFDIAMAWMLFREHRPLVDAHLAAGGKLARWYLATLLFLCVSVVGLAVWQFLEPPSPRSTDVPEVPSQQMP